MKKYRLHSVLFNLGIVNLLSFALGTLFGIVFVVAPSSFYLVLAAGIVGICEFVGPIIAIVLGLVRPYASETSPSLGRRVFAWAAGLWCVAQLVIASIVAVLWICAVVYWLIDGYVDDHYADFETARKEIPRAFSEVLEDMPHSASNIWVLGSFGFMGGTYSVRASLSEQEFLDYMAEKRFPIGTNTCIDVNRGCDLSYESMVVNSFGGEFVQDPTNYYSYAFIYTNFGGRFIIYDRDTSLFYYNYSSR